MKIWKLLAVALVCVALMMSLIACDSNNNTEEGNNTDNTEENNSFWDNLWDGVLDTFGGGNNDNNDGDNQKPSGDDPTPPVFEGGEGQSPNDAYPDYGQEIIY